ncbi:hypothetical protein GCM10027174_12190 [Salinifilum aidingensis]
MAQIIRNVPYHRTELPGNRRHAKNSRYLLRKKDTGSAARTPPELIPPHCTSPPRRPTSPHLRTLDSFQRAQFS